MRYVVLLFALVVSIVPVGAQTVRTVPLGQEPILVRLRQGQPTEVHLPEPIAAVPTGADPQQFSLEVEGSRLYLQPRVATLHGVLFALGVSGTSYPIRFRTASPADTTVVVIRPAGAARTPAAPALPAAGRPPVPSAAGLTVRHLLVAMLHGTAPPGVSSSPATHIVLQTDAGRRIVATRRYQAGPLHGYLARADNPTATPWALHLPGYYTPGLKVMAARPEVVPPHGQAQVYLVFQPSVPY